MSYRFVYPNGTPVVGSIPANGYNVDPAVMSAGYPNGGAAQMYDDYRRRPSYSPGSYSSDSGSTDDYEYRGRVITRETRCPRDVVRAPTPPPIIKRVVERAPTPEAPVMERVIIRPQAQEIVERVIEQPRTPPPRIIQKEMHEEAPPPIVRTRVIKVDRPCYSGYNQLDSAYGHPCHGLASFSNGAMAGSNPYRTQSIVGSIGRPVAFHNVVGNNPSFSSASSFEYVQPPAPMATAIPPPMTTAISSQPMATAMPTQPMATAMPTQPMTSVLPQPSTMMMMMPPSSQQVQPLGVMQQPVQQPVQQQMMYRPVPMQPSMPQMTSPPMPGFQSNYMSQNFMYPTHQGMSFGYRPLMQQGRMIPSGMPMMPASNTLATPGMSFPSQPPMFNPMSQQLVY